MYSGETYQNMVIWINNLSGDCFVGRTVVIYAATIRYTPIPLGFWMQCSSHTTNQGCCEGNMTWINPSKIIHDIANHKSRMGLWLSVLLDVPSLSLSLSRALPVSNDLAFCLPSKQKPEFGCYLKQAAFQQTLWTPTSQVAGVMARGWLSHELIMSIYMYVYHVCVFWLITPIIIIMLIHHVLNGWHELWCHQSGHHAPLEDTSLPQGWDHLQLSGEGRLSLRVDPGFRVNLITTTTNDQIP